MDRRSCSPSGHDVSNQTRCNAVSTQNESSAIKFAQHWVESLSCPSAGRRQDHKGCIDRPRRPSLGSDPGRLRGDPRMAKTPYDTDLDRNPANFQPLTPLSLLDRAASVYPDHVAIIHGGLRRSYGEFYARARRLASALAKRGVGPGD